MFGVIHVVLYSFLTTPRQYNAALSAARGVKCYKMCPWEKSRNTRMALVGATASSNTHPVGLTTARASADMLLGMQDTALQHRAATFENRVSYNRPLPSIPAQALRIFWHMRGRNLHWFLMAKIFGRLCSFLEECKYRCGRVWLTCSGWLSINGSTSGKTCGTSPQYDGLKLQQANKIYEQLVMIFECRQKRAITVFRAMCDLKPLSWRQLLLFSKRHQV